MVRAFWPTGPLDARRIDSFWLLVLSVPHLTQPLRPNGAERSDEAIFVWFSASIADSGMTAHHPS